MKKPAHRKKRPGRPKGSQNVMVKPGFPLVSNLGLAVFGDMLESDGALHAGFLWEAVHPAEKLQGWRKYAEENGFPENGHWVKNPSEESVEKYVMEHAVEWGKTLMANADSAARAFGEESFHRCKSGDVQFFKDVWVTLDRFNSGRFVDDKLRLEILTFAERKLRDGPLVVSEVREYLKEQGIHLADAAIRRALRGMGILFMRGKPGRRAKVRRYRDSERLTKILSVIRTHS